MKSYILSLDQGTSSSRAILFDTEGNMVAKDQQPVKQYYPIPGHVEQNPFEILETLISAAKNAISAAGIQSSQIASIGITNQRETIILWDKDTGKPVYNAIVWQDRRTSAFCAEMAKSPYANIIREKTGLLVDPYFSATKIKWILDNVSGVREKAIKRQILAGTVETWIIWNLTGWNIHATDVTNASRTMLFNIRKMEWDAGLAGLFDIPSGILPEVVSCSEPAGFTNAAIFGHEIPITGIAGDQQAALFGHTCFEPGDIKNTYGTGCFILMNAGYEVPVPESGMLATVGWKIRNEVVYATEGSVFIAGAAVKWLRDSLGIIETVAESEILARSIESNDGVYVVPAFSGLGAPYWNPDARGAIIGMTQGTTSAHIVRATLEAIAYQSKDVILAMQKDTGIGGGTLFADGGAAANDFLMQFQADMLSMTINRPRNIECTATGAAYLAGLTIGAWDMQRLKEIHLADRIFVPDMPPSEVEKNYAGWKNAVQSVIQSTP